MLPVYLWRIPQDQHWSILDLLKLQLSCIENPDVEVADNSYAFFNLYLQKDDKVSKEVDIDYTYHSSMSFVWYHANNFRLAI